MICAARSWLSCALKLLGWFGKHKNNKSKQFVISMELGQLLRCVACQKAPPKRTRRTFIVQAPQFRNGPLQFLARRLTSCLLLCNGPTIVVQPPATRQPVTRYSLPGTRYSLSASVVRDRCQQVPALKLLSICQGVA